MDAVRHFNKAIRILAYSSALHSLFFFNCDISKTLLLISGCTAYDVVINPTFYNKIQNSELFKSFFLTIVFEGLESKYDMELERKWTVLKNKKCMGVLQPHCIRSKSKPVIMEMESETKPGSIRSKVFLFKPFGPVICKWSNPVLHKQLTILVVTLFSKVSAQPHTTLCIQFLDRENNDKNNILPLGKQICFTMV